MSDKKDIRISNKLLSFVFGDKCKFTNIKGNKFSFDHLGFTFNLDEYKTIVLDDTYCEINIFEFIHLAKIKAFECGYEIVEYSNSVKILGKKKFYPKVNYNRFTVELTIESLEWVAEKVGCDNV